VEPDVLTGPQLRDLVDVAVGHHADHGVPTGHRVVRTEDHG
jgi:hypothetical protein